MPQIHPGDPLNLGYLMLDGAQAMTLELVRRLAKAGFDDLRPAHLHVAQHLDERGSRVTDLAERAQLTKQTVVHTVNDLERRGYVKRLDDRHDARSKLVTPTRKGRKAITVARRAVRSIERDWARLLGAKKLEQLRSLLLHLNGRLWPDTSPK